MVNPGVIDADYSREIKVVLIKLGPENYKIYKGDKIAQLIIERIISEEAILVLDLEATIRETKGFGSSNQKLTQQVGVVPDCLLCSPRKLRDDQKPKAVTICH